MSDLDLDAIEARAKDASDGPWIVVHEPAWEADNVQHPDVIRVGAPLYVGDDEPVTVCLVSTDYEDDPVDVLGDAEFIAHARTDVPALVAEVRRLREGVDADLRFLAAAAASERDDARAAIAAVRALLTDYAAAGDWRVPLPEVERALDVRHDPSAPTERVRPPGPPDPPPPPPGRMGP